MRANTALEAHRVDSGNVPCTQAASGVLIVDKPEAITSFSLVARIKRRLRLKKAGHCGTLDPFATGVLVICLNQATRIADQLSMQDKSYRFSIHFGVETDTLDKTGQVVRTYQGTPVSEDDLRTALSEFTGPYIQQVPRYAAVKVQGKRLYELARQGIEVDLPMRQVLIHQLKLVSYEWPEAQMEVRCSKGTYVRQLAADLGRKLNCGAHVKELRRLASGSFAIGHSVTLDELEQASSDGQWRTKLISMNDALTHLPQLSIEDEEILKNLYNGHLDPEWESSRRGQFSQHSGPVRLLAGGNRLAALWWPRSGPTDRDTSRSLRVFKLN